MSGEFRLTLGQLNPVMGDLAGNRAKALAAHRAGAEAGSDLVVLPEMFLTGYQPQDLVLKPAFVAHAAAELEALARDCAEGPALGIGLPWAEGGQTFNVYAILAGGKVVGMARKHHLPNYNVFDEPRVFAPGAISGPFRVGGLRFGTPICEDGWYPDVAETMAESGAEALIVPNGSPYRRGKFDVRMNHMVARVVETGLPLVYVNMVGGQDDQVFDGGSFALNPGGRLAVQLPVFEEAVAHVSLTAAPDGWRVEAGRVEVHPDSLEQDYHAMVLALRDYLGKSGIGRVLLGLSGGVDSAIVAAIAADAVGPGNVRGVMLASEFTADQSFADARAVAEALGCRMDELSIEPARAAVAETLAPLFQGRDPDVTEENIQSRLRGLLLMGLSNKFGEMLLSTGNKSEVAVGYSTIYGDMAGGYNPLKDVYKTRVFDLCRWRNREHRGWMMGPLGEVVPERVIAKPPSAELKAGQRDEDNLPPYPVLDAILEMLVEGDRSVAEVVAAGHPAEVVRRVEGLLYRAEWKRFQSAPGTRLTTKAFWLDRRYPIVNRWRDPG